MGMRKIFILAYLLFLAPAIALADGVLIPVQPREVIEPIPGFSIKYHRVKIDIDGQVAKTEVDQVFINESDHELEGTYIFPIPEGASINDFALLAGGKRLKTRLLDKDEARRIYESIVRERKDPALLEYVGRDLIKASVYPIPARGETRIQLAYDEILPYDAGICRYAYALNTEKYGQRRILRLR